MLAEICFWSIFFASFGAGWFLSRRHWIQENNDLVDRCTYLEKQNEKLVSLITIEIVDEPTGRVVFLRKNTCAACENFWYTIHHDDFRPLFCCYCDIGFDSYIDESEIEI